MLFFSLFLAPSLTPEWSATCLSLTYHWKTCFQEAAFVAPQSSWSQEYFFHYLHDLTAFRKDLSVRHHLRSNNDRFSHYILSILVNFVLNVLTVKLGRLGIPKERRHFVFFKGVEVGFPHKWDGVDNVTKTWTLGKEEPGFQLLLMCDCGQVILLWSVGSDLQN